MKWNYNKCDDDDGVDEGKTTNWGKQQNHRNEKKYTFKVKHIKKSKKCVMNKVINKINKNYSQNFQWQEIQQQVPKFEI